MKRFEGKVVMISGGSSGIGAETAIAFAEEGAKVVITDVDEEKGRKLAEEINESGGTAVFMKHNVADAKQTKEIINKIVEKFGKLDVAFNNAGIAGPSLPISEYPEEDWERVISINLLGVYYGMKYQIQQMLKQGGGAIVNNSSILGKVGFNNASAYVAAKHAVVGLTKAAALEYASKNIRINAVNPAFIKTPLIENAGMKEGTEMYDMLVGLHPIGRLGNPREVANAVLFLSGEDASFVHGESLMVDGGYTAK
ncbi:MULTISPECIES: glucose 1-dehydrogenase [Mesotoga]|jgi:NAD(P)-dependent dehydrogenase (short-subunit alcohol dehydrogenase family)|uniref:SDR family NAD(P)-dependent oxidoreductase n=1 Tax=Mesotoga TaxID=1184396 RepID=UPI0002CC05C8|nr:MULTISPECIES: glucose 1-dehydrogenase [Mesotoga]ASO67424.1 ADHMi protein [synthetic construct]MCP5457415.1 SDR family oxidoreductase [Thermotogota bacterium]CCU83614.1 3-oxoacyl-(acyl-carrier-protein) reductase FabG [Mesotoga infera]MCP5460781.1 SDR family oxidoreductase [Thermotogota bacterium]HNQ71316.1 SDR family oxidoreductase [Mesotoga prima]